MIAFHYTLAHSCDFMCGTVIQPDNCLHAGHCLLNILHFVVTFMWFSRDYLVVCLYLLQFVRGLLFGSVNLVVVSGFSPGKIFVESCFSSLRQILGV